MPVPHGLVGVVHLPPFPGDPAPGHPTVTAVLDAARRDAVALARGGIDAIIVENFGSAPFPRGTADQPTPPAAVALLTRAVLAVLAEVDVPVGVNVLRNDARAALGIAAATEAAFIRVNVHTGAVLTDQGILQGDAWATLRDRRSLGAEAVAILADVQVKHAAPLAPRPLDDEVRETLGRGLADGVLVTGRGTGQPVALEDLHTARQAAGEAPVLVASGFSPDRVEPVCPLVDGAIVGTWVKRDGRVHQPVDADRVTQLAAAVRGRWRDAKPT